VVFGVGIDLIELARIRQVMQRHGQRFLLKVFTKHEQETCENDLTLQRLAARFACKEAVMKALGTGWSKGVGWLDIEVFSEGGRPQVRLSGGAQQAAKRLGVDVIHISLTHSDTYAAAIAMAEKREGHQEQEVSDRCAL